MRDRSGTRALFAVLALVSVSCGGGEQAAAPPAAPPTTAAPAAAAAEPASGGGGFGVAECDTFFEAYFACIDANVPEAGRDAARQAAEMTRTSLQQTATQPGGAEGLAAACTQASQMAQQSMAAYNCEW